MQVLHFLIIKKKNDLGRVVQRSKVVQRVSSSKKNIS